MNHMIRKSSMLETSPLYFSVALRALKISRLLQME